MKALLLTAIAAGVAVPAFAGSSGKLTEKNFAAMFEIIQPRQEELIWKDSIPWRTDLWEARREAAAAGKPIFLWEMDGHPLACT